MGARLNNGEGVEKTKLKMIYFLYELSHFFKSPVRKVNTVTCSCYTIFSNTNLEKTKISLDQLQFSTLFFV